MGQFHLRNIKMKSVLELLVFLLVLTLTLSSPLPSTPTGAHSAWPLPHAAWPLPYSCWPASALCWLASCSCLETSSLHQSITPSASIDSNQKPIMISRVILPTPSFP